MFAIERRDGLTVVTIERPPVNAINPEFIEKLQSLTETLKADTSTRAVLFQSGLPGKFIAGADLAGVLQAEGGEPLPERLRRLNREWRRAFLSLERLPMPTVAAISGHCLGGGLEFALSCDFRLMVDDGQATVGLTETNIGIFPGAGGTFRLPRLVGVGHAKSMIYFGKRLLAPEARAIGLVNEIYAPDAFAAGCLAFAERLARGPTRALRLAKSAIQAGLVDPVMADRIEEDGFVQAIQTEDAFEGLAAFWEKRPPVFKGR